VGSFDVDPASQASGWASAFARQCQDALDELTFLTPWTLLPPTSPDKRNDFGGLDEIPTLNELAGFEGEWLPAIEDRLSSEATPEGKQAFE
jgi:cyclic beta-1,2-glucan synthetase